MASTGAGSDSKRLTQTQAVINIFNCIIGAGLLIKPYAFALSGYYGYFAMLMAAMVSIYTASILGKVANKYAANIKANQLSSEPLKRITSISESRTLSMKYTNDKIYDPESSSSYDIHKRLKKSATTDQDSGSITYQIEPQQGRKQSIYPMLTRLSFYMTEYPKLSVIAGNYVRFSVFACQFTIMINFIIINWTLLQDIVHYFITQDENIFFSESALYIYTSCIMLITVLFLSWDGLTWLSWISALSVFLISVSLIVFAVISGIEYGGPVEINEQIENNSNTAGVAAESMSVIQIICVTFSLFVMGLTAHAALPLIYVDLREDLKTDKSWNKILLLSFGGSSIFYTLIGAVGGWLYGDNTNIVCLVNIFQWPGGLYTPFISLVVFINIWSSFGIVSTVLFEIIEKSNLFGFVHGYSNNGVRLFRICGGIILCGFTYVIRKHLTFFTVANSFFNILGVALLMPILMYSVSFYKTMGIMEKVLNMILILITVALGIFTVYTDVVSLY